MEILCVFEFYDKHHHCYKSKASSKFDQLNTRFTKECYLNYISWISRGPNTGDSVLMDNIKESQEGTYLGGKMSK